MSGGTISVVRIARITYLGRECREPATGRTLTWNRVVASMINEDHGG